MVTLLKENQFTKINIDENCIVGWAERYYRENENAPKSAFIGDTEGKVKITGEIRKPTHFKEFIYPYKGKNNVRFQYLMDKLNDKMQKKNLGAFYTPSQYVEKSLELVKQAIQRVPKGNDYIILDRCAGTGNLQKLMDDEMLSHCIVSTIEYYEYKVLLEVLGDKVRHIIPPTEKEDTFNMGLVRGADALSEEYINNPIIKQYIDNPTCSIILFENPPYSEVNGNTMGEGKKATWKKSYVATQMKEEVKGTTTNDLSNLFIWSAFKYYLRQETDSYIVYSPIKYWKSQKLIEKTFLSGFAFNRKHFHTKTNACISCIYWQNKKSNQDVIQLEAFDIVNNQLEKYGDLPIKQVHSLISKFYDKTRLQSDALNGIALDLNGLEYTKYTKYPLKPIYSKNIIAYVVANGQGFDNPRLNSALTVTGRYDAHGEFIRLDNFLSILPIFSAGKYTDHYNHWTIMSQLMKSADGYDKYMNDVKAGKLDRWLLKNVLWTSLTHYSHMRSLNGSDGRFYRNELCLDNTNGETIASTHLKKLKLNAQEQELLQIWNLVLKEAKKTTEYNSSFTYGLYQIDEELNTTYKNEQDQTVYNYPILNGHIKTLKEKTKQYYLKEIAPVLFEYEFLK